MHYQAAAKSAKTAVAVLSGPTRSYQGWVLIRMGKLSRSTRRYIVLRSSTLRICSTENPRSEQFSLCLASATIYPTNAKNECQIRCEGYRIWIVCQDERQLRLCRAACEFAMRRVEDHFKLVTHRQLGKGRSSEVVFAFDTVSGDHAAVKVMNKDKARNTDLEFAEKEVRIRMTIQHPCIVQTLDIFESAYDLFVVMELMAGGPLDRRLNKHNVPLSEQDARTIMRRLFSALLHLHSRGIAHRNVKPQNIFLDVSDTIDWAATAKLTDFGLACYLEDPRSSRRIVGTPEYLAPEASIMTRTVDGERGVVFGTEVDMWAAGVTLYNLLSLELPFEGEYPPDVFKKARTGKLCFSSKSFSHASPEAISLIRSLLNVDRRKRPTAQTVLLHRWFCDQKTEKKRDATTETRALALTSKIMEISEGQARFRAATLAIRVLYRLMLRTPGINPKTTIRVEKKFQFNVSGVDIAPIKSDLMKEPKSAYDMKRSSPAVLSRLSTGSTVKTRSSLGGDSTMGFPRTTSADSRPMMTKRSDTNTDYFSRIDPRLATTPTASFGPGEAGVHRLKSSKAGHFSTVVTADQVDDQPKSGWRWRRRSSRPGTGER